MQYPRPYLLKIVITFGEELIRFLFRRRRSQNGDNDE